MPGRSTTFSTPPAASASSSASSPRPWHSFCREFGLQEFARRSDAAHHHRPHPGARADHSARRRGDQALERRGAVGEARCAQHLLLADQPARGSAAGSACAAARRARQQFNADGKPFRVPALPVEWNGGNIGEGLKVPVLGADTEPVRAELEPEKFLQPETLREARMTRVQDIYPDDRSACAKSACATACNW